MSNSRKNAVGLPKSERNIVMSVGRVVPYEQISEELGAGNDAWVEGLSRATAHEAAKRLTRKLKKEVRQASYYYKGAKGYLFYEPGKARH